MKVIRLDTLLHEIESGDAPVHGYRVMEWLKSRAYEYEPMPYLGIKYSNDSVPILKRRPSNEVSKEACGNRSVPAGY